MFYLISILTLSTIKFIEKNLRDIVTNRNSITRHFNRDRFLLRDDFVIVVVVVR